MAGRANRLIELMQSANRRKPSAVMEAMFKMRKMDIAALEAAAKG